MRIYLAGPIFGCNDAECKDWRATARAQIEAAGHEVLDPMRHDYRGREHEPGIDSGIVRADKLDIENADAVIVYFDHPSVGTSMEVLYAYMLNRPVHVFNANGSRLSPWLTFHATAVHARLETAIDAALAR